MAERFASVSEDELCEKCIIKQLLNSVSHDIMNYQNLVSVLSAEAFQITQTSVLIIHVIMLISSNNYLILIFNFEQNVSMCRSNLG